jgi:hypothetical protein
MLGGERPVSRRTNERSIDRSDVGTLVRGPDHHGDGNDDDDDGADQTERFRSTIQVCPFRISYTATVAVGIAASFLVVYECFSH